MDTAEFIGHIWPTGENFFIVEVTKEKIPKHFLVSSAEAAAKKIAQRDKVEGSSIYYAMASYTESSYVDAKGKTRRRTQANVASVKCFWVDLDCKGGTDYADQREAVLDIKRFCQAVKLPLPLFVNSGYGMHAYWVLDEPVSRLVWESAAAVFRRALDAYGVRHDPSCTTDCARILRPIGATNKKPGKPPVGVRLVGPVPPTLSFEDFLSPLRSAVSMTASPAALGTGSPIPGYIKSKVGLALNAVAEEAGSFPEASIGPIVRECSLIRIVGERGGNVSEPLWHKVLGVVKHTKEGPKAIHLFSRGHPAYSPEETEAKSAGWKVGPSSCIVLRQNAAHDISDACAGCVHQGVITSPIQLGREAVTERIEQATVVSKTGTVEVAIDVPAFPPSMCNRYRWHKGKLEKNVLDKEATKAAGSEVFEWVAFCDFLFYPAAHFLDASDKHVMVWLLREREGQFREFYLTGGAVGAGGQALFKELGDHGVTALNGGKAHMEAYILSWASELKKNATGVDTFTRFGWHDDSFLVGETLYSADGTTKKVRVSGDAASMVKDMTPMGSLAEWKRLIKIAYSNPGDEPYQFLLGLGFGSVLMPFLNVGGGVVVSAVSYSTGKGKTTAIRNAFGIYGSNREDTNVTLSNSSTTQKGIFAVAGKLHNLPLIVDELTNVDGLVASDVVYTYSQGQPRMRLTSTGKMAPRVEGWSGVMLQSSNKSLISIISSAKPGANAEIARVIEFDCTVVKTLSKREADTVFTGLKQNYGVAAEPYIRYLVTHRAEVKDLLLKLQPILDKRFKFVGEDRFWSAGFTAGIAGLIIARRLGLVDIDIDALLRWCDTQVLVMRGEITNAVATPSESFSMMLRDLGPGLIVTDVEGGRGNNGKEAYVIKEPTSRYTGRVIIKEGTAYLAAAYVHQWCAEHQIDFKEMMKAAFDRGWLKSTEAERKYPGRGTNYAMGQMRCFTLDWAKLESSVGVTPILANVVQLLRGNE